MSKSRFDDPMDILCLLNAGVLTAGQARILLARSGKFAPAEADRLVAQRRLPWWDRFRSRRSAR